MVVTLWWKGGEGVRARRPVVGRRVVGQGWAVDGGIYYRVGGCWDGWEPRQAWKRPWFLSLMLAGGLMLAGWLAGGPKLAGRCCCRRCGFRVSVLQGEMMPRVWGCWRLWNNGITS